IIVTGGGHERPRPTTPQKRSLAAAHRFAILPCDMATDTSIGGGRRTAMVTGGSRGIGRAIAVALGAEGYNVVVNYARNAAAAEAAQREIQARGGRAHLVQADIAV